MIILGWLVVVLIALVFTVIWGFTVFASFTGFMGNSPEDTLGAIVLTIIPVLLWYCVVHYAPFTMVMN